MYITLKAYLDRIETEERSKPASQRRRVPSMEELAQEIGMHRVSLSRIANNGISDLNLETGGKIISAMRRFGFPMEASDFVAYAPIETPAPE